MTYKEDTNGDREAYWSCYNIYISRGYSPEKARLLLKDSWFSYLWFEAPEAYLALMSRKNENSLF